MPRFEIFRALHDIYFMENNCISMPGVAADWWQDSPPALASSFQWPRPATLGLPYSYSSCSSFSFLLLLFFSSFSCSSSMSLLLSTSSKNFTMFSSLSRSSYFSLISLYMAQWLRICSYSSRLPQSLSI